MSWAMRKFQSRFLTRISLAAQTRDCCHPWRVPGNGSRGMIGLVGDHHASSSLPNRTTNQGFENSMFLRLMSSSSSLMVGRSMRSRVERRMRNETGKTLREIRHAKRLRKKLMTDEERLVHSLRRAKKKVALLLQQLKKYELPELPESVHDPEILTPEQLQAFKKIGFRNRNYVPVGVRGIFGGVVQNMHMHWKFHETVQVCCDNFPKEKIKEMATMLARLSGGIVVNIHKVNTIIMYRGRNYRQPKILIPINTLTKRKALFKARFEQALESQKLNIKTIEQKLRRMGVNPEDPVAMASVRRVASTFFRAIDKKQGTPSVFLSNRQPPPEPDDTRDVKALACDDSDQEDLDRFIAEIEDAADKEWVAEEAAEKEELEKIRYWNKDDPDRGNSRRVGRGTGDSSVYELDRDRNSTRGILRSSKVRHWNSDDEEVAESGSWAEEDEEDINQQDHEQESDDEVSLSWVKNSKHENNKQTNKKNRRIQSPASFPRETRHHGNDWMSGDDNIIDSNSSSELYSDEEDDELSRSEIRSPDNRSRHDFSGRTQLGGGSMFKNHPVRDSWLSGNDSELELKNSKKDPYVYRSGSSDNE